VILTTRVVNLFSIIVTLKVRINVLLLLIGSMLMPKVH